MRILVALLFVLIAATALLSYPPLHEESDGACSALEQRIAELASHDRSGRLVVGPLYGSSSSNPSPAAYVRDHYPLLPAEIGCTVAYWKTMIDPSLPALPAEPSAPAEAATLPSGEPERRADGLVSTIARGMTPNGDPISPATIFTLPMDAVSVRVEYPGGRAGAARFQLHQGRAVIAACSAERSAPGVAWCTFNVSLRKGNYIISFTANNMLLGQFPFTVIGSLAR
jgi:hypothetical protein